jgi:hypothetical protein
LSRAQVVPWMLCVPAALMTATRACSASCSYSVSSLMSILSITFIGGGPQRTTGLTNRLSVPPAHKKSGRRALGGLIGPAPFTRGRGIYRLICKIAHSWGELMSLDAECPSPLSSVRLDATPTGRPNLGYRGCLARSRQRVVAGRPWRNKA